MAELPHPTHSMDGPGSFKPVASKIPPQLSTLILIKGSNSLREFKILTHHFRWSNPLMGWSSTGDPLSNTIVEFSELEDAIAYCEKNQWNFEVEQPQTLRRLSKSYGTNYAWNKRTRTSAK
jgi:NADH dehydrogenase (ubiquinone) Fe-S protein 4